MSELGWLHWIVDDEGFTDRWEYDDGAGRFGWVDRVVDGDRVAYEYEVDGRHGTCDSRVAAMAAVTEVLDGR